MTKKKYTVHVEHKGKWWFIQVQGLPFAMSQCRQLRQVDQMAREVIAMVTEVEESAVGELDIHVVTPMDTQSDLAQLVNDTERLAALTVATSENRTSLVRRLQRGGLSTRDIAYLVGISHQRVSQLTAQMT